MSIIETISKYLVCLLVFFVVSWGLNVWHHAFLLGGTHHKFMFGLCDNEDPRFTHDLECLTILERTPIKNNMLRSGLGRRI